MTQPLGHDSEYATEYDVVIVGGGLVGASLAVALAPTGLSLAVVEAVAADSGAQPSFDERTVALTDNARRIYTGMGVWAEIAAHHAEPIHEIHISDRGRFGMTHLHRDSVGVEALGYVVPSRVIGQVLHRRMRQSEAVSLFCPATVGDLRQRAHHRDGRRNEHRNNMISVFQNGHNSHNGHNKKPLRLTANLIVVADGGRSNLAAQSGVALRHSKYQQSAILSVVASDRDHHGRAYERFTDEGPLALLPHSDKRYALVWTTGPQQLAARMALSDAAFVDALQRAFGDRAGNFHSPTARKSYPLQRYRVDNPVGRRTVIIGNAAHTVHPVAGQGFNLGLRDVAALAEIIHRAARRHEDIGSPALLEEYAAARRRETRMVGAFTDGLIEVFGSRRATVGWARNLALAGIELFPPAKGMLLRRTLGLTGNRRGWARGCRCAAATPMTPRPTTPLTHNAPAV